MRPQSCNYQQMYEMPCRMACNRYTSVGDQFEGAAPKENYEYEPEISREMYVPIPMQHNNVSKFKQKKQEIKNKQVQSCNCAPKIYIKEDYDYDPSVYQNRVESFEMATGADNCGCGVMNPPYRMSECNYNQSPSWVTQKFVPPNLPPTIQENYQSPSEDCGCGMKNTSYRMGGEQCDYNQSPTWGDQADFRANVLNKY